ncbi:MAG: class I SAM-dependent methyltransferase [Bacteroidota bacterium]
MSSVRTKEDFDKFFVENNGDPWGYQTKYVKERLDKSIKFIQKSVSREYTGVIIEFGSYEGSFTTRLIANFPSSTIVAVDISEVAHSQNLAKNGISKNVTFFCEDMLKFDFRTHLNKSESIFLLLECLYYLSDSEREKMVQTIHENAVSNKTLFISSPMVGGKYFSEKDLISLLEKYNYKKTDFAILNSKVYRFSLLNQIVSIMGQYSKLIRKKYANQIIFKFEKK